MTQAAITTAPVSGKKDFDAFVDLAYRINADDPNWVAPLRMEVVELLTKGGNPFHEHADMQLFLARRSGKITGRISAHIDHLALTQPPAQGMGPGTGNWGLLEAEDQETAAALIDTAEGWLRQQGMTRVLAPISLSIWEEPGLLVKGFDQPPTVMMGRDSPLYKGWIEASAYTKAKSLVTYDLEITAGFPPIINRIVASGERNARINIRQVDLKQFDRDARIILAILNDAWSENWGFVPFTENEIAYAAKKIKPLIHADLNMIAEVDGQPMAFMMTLPDLNPLLHKIGPKPSLLGWAKLLWWLRKPKATTMRVPLMGVVKELQNTRMASQLAFMMIEYIRRNAIANYATTRAEIGWVLDDNQGMVAIADAIQSKPNHDYWIYEKQL